VVGRGAGRPARFDPQPDDRLRRLVRGGCVLTLVVTSTLRAGCHARDDDPR
jgi:hypothetical protein